MNCYSPCNLHPQQTKLHMKKADITYSQIYNHIKLTHKTLIILSVTNFLVLLYQLLLCPRAKSMFVMCQGKYGEECTSGAIF